MPACLRLSVLLVFLKLQYIQSHNHSQSQGVGTLQEPIHQISLCLSADQTSHHVLAMHVHFRCLAVSLWHNNVRATCSARHKKVQHTANGYAAVLLHVSVVLVICCHWQGFWLAQQRPPILHC